MYYDEKQWFNVEEHLKIYTGVPAIQLLFPLSTFFSGLTAVLYSFSK